MVELCGYPRDHYLCGVDRHTAGVLGRRIGSPAGQTKMGKRPVDLDLAAHRESVRLPKELVDHIISMLHDDLRTLEACSLTCKAMLASARRFIHQSLR